MNQAILKPREDDRYLAVVVSKDDSNFYARGNKLWYKKKYSKHTSEFDDYTKMKVIGLLSNITEEQARELGFFDKDEIWTHCDPYYDTSDLLGPLAVLRLKLLSSGLTYNSERTLIELGIAINKDIISHKSIGS